jgi:copper chaperone CopZ
MARLDVSGMMCAHACGGKIKKELLEIPGVANATIDFENSRGVNFADVEYDPGQVSSDQLVAVITQIADGRLYGVDAVQVTHFAKAADLP